MARRVETVKGYRIEKPKLTRAGYGIIARKLVLPLLAILALLDLLLYVIFRYGFDKCYGLTCFF